MKKNKDPYIEAFLKRSDPSYDLRQKLQEQKEKIEDLLEGKQKAEYQPMSPPLLFNKDTMRELRSTIIKALERFTLDTFADLDPHAIEVIPDIENQSMNINLIPALHNLPPKAQIDFACNMFDISKEDFDFSFNEYGYMSISPKKSIDQVSIKITVTPESFKTE